MTGSGDQVDACVLPVVCSETDIVVNSCAFYEDCVEREFLCGLDGYPLGFGKHFCNRYMGVTENFSLRGQVIRFSPLLQ